MTDLPWISVADLADGAADTAALDEAGRVAQPLAVVDLDGDAEPGVLERAVPRARNAGRLVLGIAAGPLPPGAGPLVSALDRA